MNDNDNDLPEIPVETLAETENYVVWSAEEPDGETTYHVELGPVTVHFFGEEWEDFIDQIFEAGRNPEMEDSDDEPSIEVELDWGSLYFSPEEWQEFFSLIEQAG